jgi:hypothetical protein
MGAALGFSEGGSRLPAFVKGAKINPYVGRALAEKLENPIIFQSQAVGAGTPSTTTHGYFFPSLRNRMTGKREIRWDPHRKVYLINEEGPDADAAEPLHLNGATADLHSA